MDSAAPSALRASLETSALRALLDEWHTVNANYFKRALRPPAFELSDGDTRLGLWDASHRRIAMARSLVFEQPWSAVAEVLKHEIAHQYVHEVLQVTDETAHGEAFRMICGRLGIDAAASGMPLGQGRSEEEERVLQRVAKLLALAESPNEHEAQSAMNQAQRLMLKYNLTLGERRPDYHFRQLGEITGRMSEWERILGGILNKHFFVEVIYISAFRVKDGLWGRALEISGSAANVAMAEYVYDFLAHTSERLWREHRRKHGIASNQDRRAFLAGVMRGFDEKLQGQTEQHRQEGLVWVGDPQLREFFHRRHPHIRNVRYGGSDDTEAYAHGREAGRQIILHKPVSEGSSGGGMRLLGSGKR